jgi:hypothetical protein
VALPAHTIEQVVMVPKVGAEDTVDLETTIFRPPGEGRRPLVVINHGKTPGKPAFQRRALCRADRRIRAARFCGGTADAARLFQVWRQVRRRKLRCRRERHGAGGGCDRRA